MYPITGWLTLPGGVGLTVVGVLVVFSAIRSANDAATIATSWTDEVNLFVVGAGVVLVFAGLLVLRGLFVIQPNNAVVLTIFGYYRGTVRASGLRWVLPFYRRRTISLRLRSLDGSVIKVNDRGGNPIELSMVVTWAVGDTAKASFGVEDFSRFVAVQSEAALRDVASSFLYDSGDPSIPSLRSNDGQVLEALHGSLRHRLARSGVIVDEARINHLAYAPEIASAMLRRQQAQAVIDARALIASGATAIVASTLSALRAHDAVDLDEGVESRLAANLLVVLTSQTDTVTTVPLATD